MKKQIRIELKLADSYNWNSRRYADRGVLSICNETLSEYFKIPKDVKTIDLIISDAPMAQCYKMKTELGYGRDYLYPVQIQIPGDKQGWAETLSLFSDRFLIAMGLGETTKYVEDCYCEDCKHFDGEECRGYLHEGEERYGYQPACEDYEEE